MAPPSAPLRATAVFAAFLLVALVVSVLATESGQLRLNSALSVAVAVAVAAGAPRLPPPPPPQPSASPAPAPLGDGCRHVYLDMGTNIGIQFRKLFTPLEYPNALMREPFERFFGPGTREDVCAWGWEPNARHAANLTKLQNAYRALGRRLTIFTGAAAGVFDGLGVFKSDNDMKNHEWGGSVEAAPVGVPPPDGAVRIMDVAAWIATNVLPRRVPPGVNGSDGSAPRAPAIVVKIDIEGSDEGVLAELLHRDVLCHFDFVYIEDRHVRREVIDFLNTATSRTRSCRGRTSEDPIIRILDDEMYYLEEWKDPTRRRARALRAGGRGRALRRTAAAEDATAASAPLAR